MRPILAALSLSTAAAAAAQTNFPALPLVAGKPYRHAPTGLEIPAALGGLPRTRSVAFVAERLDETIEFQTPDAGEDISVFVFRRVTGSVPVWFDRSARVIERRDIYKGATALRPPTAFVPPGQDNTSALLVSYRIPKGRYRGTALAYVPLGPDWYVVFRDSSATLDAEAVEARLRASVAALKWPKKIGPQPAAVPVSDCTGKLALSGPSAEVKVKDALTSALIGGLMSAPAKSKRRADLEAAPVTWCRDPAAFPGLEQHGLYRPDGRTDSYLVAFEDAGRGVMVAPDGAAGLLDKATDAPPVWRVSLIEMAQITNFAGRDRLPPPDQANEIVEHSPYVSKVGTWGKARTIQFNPGLTK